MKKLISLILLIFFTSFLIFAIDVDEDELHSYGDKKIEFYNYVGPHQFVNTKDQILQLGIQLGNQVNPDQSGNFTIGNKYSVIHSVQPDILELLDGDIFFVGRDGAVDHIRNLRYIIASYLQSAYKYNFDDAFLLAEFVTYYNAAFYKNFEYYQSSYKNGVIKYLSEDRAGLSTHYSEWAGKSAIVIPLSESRSSETGKTIDTGVVTSEEVIDVIRKEDDAGIDTRQDMVELRDKEISEEQDAIEEEKDKLADEKDQIDKTIEDIKTEDDGTLKTEDDLTESEKAEIKDLEDQKEDITDEEAKLDKEQEALEEDKEEVVKMREDIADDANKQIDREDSRDTDVFTSSESSGTEILILKIENSGSGIPYGKLVKIDIDNNKITAESSLNSIRGRSLTILGGKLIVVAGKDSGTGAVKLMEIDSDTLEIRKEGTVPVFSDTLLWTYKNNFFAIINEENVLKLALFDDTLTLKVSSDVSVEPYMSPVIKNGSIFVQITDGSFVELSTETLEVLNKIE